MGLRDLGRAWWRQRLLVLLVLVVTALAVAAGVALAPRDSEATAVVQAVADPAVDAGRESTDALRARLADLADSRAVAEEVRRTTGVDRGAEELQAQLSGRWVPGTVVIEVRAEDPEPRVAAEIANAAAVALAVVYPRSGFLLSVSERAERSTSGTSGPDLLLVLGLVLGVGLVVALVIAVVAAAVRDARARTVGDGAAVETATSAPLLAHLQSPADLTTMPALHPGTDGAEAFRRMVVALEAATARHPASRVVVASVTGGEEPVWVGANMAICLAVPPRRVLLVDGRMGPQHGPRAQEEPDTPGLHGVLAGARLEEAISPGPVPELVVLPAGGWDAGPRDILVEEHFAGFAEQAARVADVAVVLGPALDASDDARVMAAGAVLLLVVPAGRISNTELRAHADRVRAAGARVAGVILVDRRALGVRRSVWGRG